MNLREFASNDIKSITRLNEEDQVSSKIVKILGIEWDTVNDSFSVKTKFEESEKTTKRTVLKTIASAYDPMGWLTPAMLKAKIFFQRLWKEKINWDDQLNKELSKDWKAIGRNWNHRIEMPRRLFANKTEKFELHLFADASKEAHGAVAYLKNTQEKEARLIFAKSRLNTYDNKVNLKVGVTSSSFSGKNGLILETGTGKQH